MWNQDGIYKVVWVEGTEAPRIIKARYVEQEDTFLVFKLLSSGAIIRLQKSAVIKVEEVLV